MYKWWERPRKFKCCNWKYNTAWKTYAWFGG